MHFPRLTFFVSASVYAYLAFSECLKSLVAGEFVISGEHGCFTCIEGASAFVANMPSYVIAGLLAATVTQLIIGRSGAAATAGFGSAS